MFNITTYNFLTSGSKLQRVPSVFACLYFPLIPSLSRSTQVLQKPCQGNFGKFQGSGQSRFGGSERDRYFFKIPKWQHELVRDYKRGKLVYYFLNNTAETCLYELKISENIETEHAFKSKAFFRLSSNLHTSCLNAFKYKNDCDNKGSAMFCHTLSHSASLKISERYIKWKIPDEINPGGRVLTVFPHSPQLQITLRCSRVNQCSE